MAAEIMFMRGITGYTWHCKWNLDVMEELNIQPVMKFVEKYRAKWNALLNNSIPDYVLPQGG
jgi:hypothetical protein